MLQPYPEVLALARADHFTARRSHVIDTGVLHATQGTRSLDWLRWQSNPPVSCHVLIDKAGVRYRIVPDSGEAWHAGKGLLQLAQGPSVNINRRSLGLELENLNDGADPYPEAQLDSAAYQMAQWCYTYPVLRWYRHSELDGAKRDPAGLDYTALLRRVQRYMCRLYGV